MLLKKDLSWKRTIKIPLTPPSFKCLPKIDAPSKNLINTPDVYWKPYSMSGFLGVKLERDLLIGSEFPAKCP